jgi:hypothetical protein
MDLNGSDHTSVSLRMTSDPKSYIRISYPTIEKNLNGLSFLLFIALGNMLLNSFHEIIARNMSHENTKGHM